jgi:hypothetical protein
VSRLRVTVDQAQERLLADLSSFAVRVPTRRHGGEGFDRRIFVLIKVPS